MRLGQLADLYLERYVRVERASTEQAFVWALNTICKTPIPRPTGGPAPLGTWRLTDVVTDTIERFREVRRKQGTGVVGTNRHLGTLRALFNWGVRVGYLEHTPFKRGAEPVVRLADEPSRSRRLDADIDEETKLLATCGAHLRAVMEAALETGMRRGEISSLEWKQIEGMKVNGSRVAWGLGSSWCCHGRRPRPDAIDEFRSPPGSRRFSNCDASIRQGRLSRWTATCSAMRSGSASKTSAARGRRPC